MPALWRRGRERGDGFLRVAVQWRGLRVRGRAEGEKLWGSSRADTQGWDVGPRPCEVGVE